MSVFIISGIGLAVGVALVRICGDIFMDGVKTIFRPVFKTVKLPFLNYDDDE